MKVANRLSCARIEEAYEIIDPRYRDSPQVSFEALDSILGTQLELKVETLNPIRSFKGRGAQYYVHCAIHVQHDRTPLVVSSVGNFGLALAQATRLEALPLTVFAPRNADEAKLRKMRELNAQIELAGEDLDGAKEAAKDYADRMGHKVVEDGFDTAISEGAGTIALELLRDASDFDAVLIPLGGGAILNGMGTWIKAHAPNTHVIGVCAQGAPSMAQSWHGRQRTCSKKTNTIAEGIAIRTPVPTALEDMHQLVDDVLLVDDETMLQAMRLLLAHCGLLVEPAGAVGLAAILAHRDRFTDRKLATPLCGGNVTPSQFSEWFL